MARWIGLLRGINVGGKNILPMAELRSDLEALKLRNVRTYIQSGNVVFDSTAKSGAALATKISGQIAARHGFRPHLFLLRCDDLRAAVDSNPFPEAVVDPKSLYFFFLDQPATDPNLARLDAARESSERYELTDSVFYLHAPDGTGRSKLAASAERHLGVATTARNFRTVEKLLSMSLENES